MKNSLIVFVAVLFLVSAFFLGGCKDDDNDNNTNDNSNNTPTACESYLDLVSSAGEAVCTEDASCVFCDCFSQGLVFDVVTTGDGTELETELVCVEPVETCDATLTEVAEQCVADEAVCLSDLTTAAESSCASPL